MSRLLLVFVYLLWMAGVSDPAVAAVPRHDTLIGLFLLAPVVLVLAVGGWARWLAPRVSARTFGRAIRQLNWVTLLARVFLVLWFAAGVFAFGWVDFVQARLRLDWFETARLPGVLVGTLPVVLAWVGLWWAQFPADHALRQQGLAENLVDGLPVHHPPGLWEHLAGNVRLQLLFTLAPLLLIAGVRDVAAALVLPPAGPRAYAPADPAREQAEVWVWLFAAGVVYLAAPALLRRILQTSPLRDGPLRRRLEALCRRGGMRYRDILVWHTHHNVGNAAVMGLVPRLRYVLLSDLLLERMDDDQIEAVFAHEIGHVVHRHMAWYIVFFLILVFVALGPMTLAGRFLDRVPLPAEAWAMVSLTASALAFWLTFGFLSRRFERQADVYAARMMEAARPADAAAGAAALAPLLGSGPRVVRQAPRRDGGGGVGTGPVASHVGAYGASLFASALHRVATINNIPVGPRSRRGHGLLDHVSYLAGNLMDLAHDWLHGSIHTRMEYLRSLSADPALTGRFDRLMGRLYGALLFVLIASAAYVVPMLVR